MSHSSRRHRALDAAHAEAMARDGDHGANVPVVGPDHGGALLPSRLRYKDLRTMNPTSNRRVLLTVLSVRTSTKGTEYLSGYLAKAKVVAFRGEPDKYGQETWNVYVSEPEGRPGTTLPDNLRQRQERASSGPGDGGVGSLGRLGMIPAGAFPCATSVNLPAFGDVHAAEEP